MSVSKLNKVAPETLEVTFSFLAVTLAAMNIITTGSEMHGATDTRREVGVLFYLCGRAAPFSPRAHLSAIS